jgi:sulfite reductase beta subunit-like hemoprotein
MATPDIPKAKRAGLPVDIARLAVDGDGWLTAEERYALKTYGVCSQLQPHVFMVRLRVPGGVISTQQARGLARVARAHGTDWVHLTTRQNVELHWVADRDVPVVLDKLGAFGLSTRSACGHTVRNVMSSEDAGVGLDEPFDCLPDAQAISQSLVERSHVLNTSLPSRLNISLGGSPRCRHDALVNDIGLVSVVVDGEPGYELWAGGSLGKSPALAILLAPFVTRADVTAAVDALIDVFVAHGSFDEPAKGRLKYLVAQVGADKLRRLWLRAYDRARHEARAAPPVVAVMTDADRDEILTQSPPGGWSQGVRPQRAPGLASVTIDLPLGDTNSSEMELFCNLADRHADGFLTLSRDQNIVFRNVPIGALTAIRAAIAARGLSLLGEGSTAQVRACTGASVCSLGITDAPGAGRALTERPSLRRNSQLRVLVSGCPNSCAQHQLGDIGLAGSKVRIGGRTVDGYQFFLGADLDAARVGEVVGRVGASHLDAAIDAVVGTWEALRHHGETLGRTVRRVGLTAFSNQILAALDDRWAVGDDADAPDALLAGRV